MPKNYHQSWRLEPFPRVQCPDHPHGCKLFWAVNMKTPEEETSHTYPGEDFIWEKADIPQQDNYLPEEETGRQAQEDFPPSPEELYLWLTTRSGIDHSYITTRSLILVLLVLEHYLRFKQTQPKLWACQTPTKADYKLPLKSKKIYFSLPKIILKAIFVKTKLCTALISKPLELLT